MSKPVFVTSNKHKAQHFEQLVGLPVDHAAVELEELQSLDIELVAEHKARQAYAALGRPVIIDDIALGFTALHGLPGTFIKYFVEAENGLETLCRMLDFSTDRTATAVAVLAYFDGTTLKLFRGEVQGTIAEHARGTNGHGWDAVFCPDGYNDLTRAELGDVDYIAVYKQLRHVDQLREFLEQ